MTLKIYYFETPNGIKPLILLEELKLPYEAIRVDITNGEQRALDFLRISPNGRIPALVDTQPANSTGNGHVALFESGAILIYLAEKAGSLLSSSSEQRWSVMSWLCWQVAGLGPLGGQYNHYGVSSNDRIEYPLKRFRASLRRLLHVMDMHISTHHLYLAHDYSIADIACFPWIHSLRNLDIDLFEGLGALDSWHERIMRREAVKTVLAKYPMKPGKLRHTI